MRITLSIILLKDPVATKNLIFIFQCNGKHFFGINSMINCSFIQNHQRRYALSICAQSNHYPLWKFLSLLNTTFFIGISTSYCPHPIILRVIDTINLKELLIRKENSPGAPFFRKFVQTQFANFFHLIF